MLFKYSKRGEGLQLRSMKKIMVFTTGKQVILYITGAFAWTQLHGAQGNSFLKGNGVSCYSVNTPLSAVVPGSSITYPSRLTACAGEFRGLSG